MRNAEEDCSRVEVQCCIGLAVELELLRMDESEIRVKWIGWMVKSLRRYIWAKLKNLQQIYFKPKKLHHLLKNSLKRAGINRKIKSVFHTFACFITISVQQVKAHQKINLQLDVYATEPIFRFVPSTFFLAAILFQVGTISGNVANNFCYHSY